MRCVKLQSVFQSSIWPWPHMTQCLQAGNNVLVAIGKRLGLILRRGAQEVFIENTKQSVGSVAHCCIWNVCVHAWGDSDTQWISESGVRVALCSLGGRVARVLSCLDFLVWLLFPNMLNWCNEDMIRNFSKWSESYACSLLFYFVFVPLHVDFV